MSHHNQKIIASIFAHPISANIDIKDIEHVMAHLGASVEQKNGNKLEITLNGKSFYLHQPHGHALPKDEVARVRDFLESCGITPEQVA